jgi:hypothetical protein
MSSTHHISRLQYKVSCSNEEQAFELRHLLSVTATEELAAKLEEVSARYVSDDVFIRIPKLEVHLAAGSLNGLAAELTVKFGAKLEEALRKLPARPQPDDAAQPAQEADALFYFLLNGVLPHWAAPLGLQMNDIAERVLHEHPQRLLRLLYENVRAQQVWSRIVFQFPAQIKEQIVGLVPELAQAHQALKETYAAWPRANNTPLPPPAEQAAVAQLITEVMLQEAPRIIPGRAATADLMHHLLAFISTPLLAFVSTPSGNLPAPGDQLPPAQPQRVQENIQIDSRQDPFILPDPAASPPSGFDNQVIAAPAEKLVTQTAGIVLLHPFLKPFFTELGLLREGQWKDEPSCQKAAHLLHYLSTGKQEEQEWNLVLEKLLCGFMPDFPIKRYIALTEEDIAECDALLKSVIGHWSALKKTSPQALQETFLQRRGLLQQTDKGWQLHVERKTQDILLEKMPWTYTMIKLTWNEYLIEVLW